MPAARRRADPPARSRRCRRASRVVHPVDRHLVDPEAGALGQHEQLRVEEPAPVLDEREQQPRPVGADRLEAALRVAEPGGERGVQDRGCRAREMTSRLRPAHDVRAAGQPSADREVAVAGDQRRDERQQRREVGREVDVHVREDGGVARRPDLVERAPAPFCSSRTQSTPSQLVPERAGDRPGRRRCSRCRRS